MTLLQIEGGGERRRAGNVSCEPARMRQGETTTFVVRGDKYFDERCAPSLVARRIMAELGE